MKKNNFVIRLTKIFSVISLLLLCNNSLLFAQRADYDKYWEYWENICYCSINDFYHPSTILSADNNLELFFALKDGLTQKQLNSLNIPNTRSQLILLETYKLIHYSDGTYKTAIPILDTSQTNRLREQSKQTANDIYPEIEKECSELVKYLKNQNLSNNAYSILFSYVLDGLIWTQFENEEIVREWDKNGAWSGNYWFLTPKRTLDCGGTNAWTKENISFKWNWSPTEKITEGLWNKNFEMLFPFITGNTTPNMEAMNEFSDYGFFDDNHRLTIPVINEKENNTLYLLANSITDKLLTAFIEKTDIETLKTSFNFNDNSETVVIFYHEVMFDIMDLLLEKSVIQMPGAFLNADKATLKDAADLCFIVISK